MREIIGNTTATPNPQSDWGQTDPAKADYIKNKPAAGDIFTTSIKDGVLVLEQSDAMCEKGDSAYEVACKNGFEGTEAEWLASLIGGGGGGSAIELAQTLESNDTDKAPSVKAVNDGLADIVGDNVLDELSTVMSSVEYVVDGLYKGVWQGAKTRVSFTKAIKFGFPVTITAKDGLQIGVSYFSEEKVSAGTYVSDTGWQTSVDVPHDTYFVLGLRYKDDRAMTLADADGCSIAPKHSFTSIAELRNYTDDGLAGKVDRVKNTQTDFLRVYIESAGNKGVALKTLSSVPRVDGGSGCVVSYAPNNSGGVPVHMNYVLVTSDPKSDYHCAPKKYVDDGLKLIHEAMPSSMHKKEQGAYDVELAQGYVGDLDGEEYDSDTVVRTGFIPIGSGISGAFASGTNQGHLACIFDENKAFLCPVIIGADGEWVEGYSYASAPCNIDDVVSFNSAAKFIRFNFINMDGTALTPETVQFSFTAPKTVGLNGKSMDEVLDEIVGNIEASLDAIIAMQEELMLPAWQGGSY